MARNISNVVDFMSYIVRKERGVMLLISDAVNALDVGQLDALEEYFKQYGVSQVVHDALKPFRVFYQFTSDAAGFVTYPAAVVHLLGTPWTVTGSTANGIRFVNEDELTTLFNSQLRPIDNSYPIAVDTAAGFSIYPQQTQIGYFWYLRRPVLPVYAYTQVGRAITYNSAGSTQLEWNEMYWNNIIARALKYVGVNMSEKEVSDFAAQYENETK